jgi:magnesium-transporting ATPase (P-type)
VRFDAGIVPLDDAVRTRLLAAQDMMAEAGLRVLAFAHGPVDDGLPGEENGLTLAGLVGLEDPPRPEVPDAVARCAAAGIRVIMVTGDHPHTALAIAREIGLVKNAQPVVITGDTLRRMTPEQLQLALDAPEILFARVAAEQKMHIVEALQHKGETVAVTGDGVNDAPALKVADIGIAMGLSGTDVAKEAADLILLDDNFASIVAAIEEGRAVFDNIRKFLTYILTSNIPELVPYLAFVLFRIPLPLTIIQILAVDRATCARAGARCGETPGYHASPAATARRALVGNIAARLPVPQAAGSSRGNGCVLLRAARQGLAIWSAGQPRQPLPAGHRRACRRSSRCRWSACSCAAIPACPRSARPNRDRLIWYGMGFELLLLLLIDYTPWGNALFGTAPLEADVWLLIIPFGIAMLLLEELRKAVVRGRQIRRPSSPEKPHVP